MTINVIAVEAAKVVASLLLRFLVVSANQVQTNIISMQGCS